MTARVMLCIKGVGMPGDRGVPDRFIDPPFEMNNGRSELHVPCGCSWSGRVIFRGMAAEETELVLCPEHEKELAGILKHTLLAGGKPDLEIRFPAQSGMIHKVNRFVHSADKDGNCCFAHG